VVVRIESAVLSTAFGSPDGAGGRGPGGKMSAGPEVLVRPVDQTVPVHPGGAAVRSPRAQEGRPRAFMAEVRGLVGPLRPRATNRHDRRPPPFVIFASPSDTVAARGPRRSRGTELDA